MTLDEIMRRMSGPNPSKPERAPRSFRVGDRVRILSGAFANFRGRIAGHQQSEGVAADRCGDPGRDETYQGQLRRRGELPGRLRI